jgi:hypothetical protein
MVEVTGLKSITSRLPSVALVYIPAEFHEYVPVGLKVAMVMLLREAYQQCIAFFHGLLCVCVLRYKALKLL